MGMKPTIAFNQKVKVKRKNTEVETISQYIRIGDNVQGESGEVTVDNMGQSFKRSCMEIDTGNAKIILASDTYIKIDKKLDNWKTVYSIYKDNCCDGVKIKRLIMIDDDKPMCKQFSTEDGTIKIGDIVISCENMPSGV